MEEIDRPAVDMDLLAASLRPDTSDLNAFVESLAAKLEDAMPGRARVDRRRSGMFGPKAVRGSRSTWATVVSSCGPSAAAS